MLAEVWGGGTVCHIVRIFAIFGILRKIVGWLWGSGNRRGSNKRTKIKNSQKATCAAIVVCKRFFFLVFRVHTVWHAGSGE